MHKRGLCLHAVSVCLSRWWITIGKPHHSSFSIPNGVAIFRREPPWWGRRMQVGYRQKWRFWTNSWLSKIAGRAKCQKHLPTTKLSRLYMTQSATYHWLLIDCWTCELRSDKNSYRRPCSVDGTVDDTPANVCLWRPAARTNMPNRRERKRI